MRIAETSDLWWKNAVIYCLDPETFFDGDGDGTGDFGGLIQRVDYLAAFELPLDRYGYRWFRVQRPGERQIP